MTGRSLTKVRSPPLSSDHRLSGFGTSRGGLRRRLKDSEAIPASIDRGLRSTRCRSPRIHHRLLALSGLSASLNTRVSRLNDVRNLLRTHLHRRRH